MAYTFLAAQGYEVGNSVLEADRFPRSRRSWPRPNGAG